MNKKTHVCVVWTMVSLSGLTHIRLPPSRKKSSTRNKRNESFVAITERTRHQTMICRCALYSCAEKLLCQIHALKCLATYMIYSLTFCTKICHILRVCSLDD